MSIEYFSAGSVFLGAIFGSLLSPQPINVESQVFEDLVNRSIPLLKEIGYIDAQLIITKFGVSIETANKIIEELIKRGVIQISKSY